jgi:cytidylate kinase
MPDQIAEDLDLPRPAAAPLHGYRGAPDAIGELPKNLSIAISRDAGARGEPIARRVADRLGWQLFNQDLLEYIAQEGSFRQNVLDELPAPAADWVEHQLGELQKKQNLSNHPSIVQMARAVLALGAQGEVVLLGRGAGYILPERSTLHVRLVAPLGDRVAFTSQWLRLTDEEAAEEVRQRDQRRADFVSTHFHRKANDLQQFDLVLNSSRLGEEVCTDLIVQAAKAKAFALQPGENS